MEIACLNKYLFKLKGIRMTAFTLKFLDVFILIDFPVALILSACSLFIWYFVFHILFWLVSDT